MRKRYLPHICVLSAGCLWGVIGLFTRNLMALGLSPRSVVGVRNLGGMLLLGLVLACTDRAVFRVRLRHLPCFFGTGVVSVLFFTLCSFTCQQMCSLAVSAILMYTAPAFVVALSALLFKDRLTGRKLAALGVAFLGCTFASGVWSGRLAASALGVALGVASGFFYGLYSIFGRYALAHYSPMTVTFYTFVFAGAGGLLVWRPSELTVLTTPMGPWLALGLVVVSTVLPYLLYTRGLSGMDSGSASILASVEPVVAALTGVAAFGEPMGPAVLLGLGCILLSVYLLR